MSERDAASDLAICDAATPGEWRWEINPKAKQMSLKSVKGGGWTVLDFVRWGMSGAKARFLDIKRCLMVDASELTAVIPGREHHASWCQSIDHPDAKFIATAREALPYWIREAERLRGENERLKAQLSAFARAALEEEMSSLSEKYSACGWHGGIETILWQCVIGETVEDWPLTEKECNILRQLSEMAGGWWADDGLLTIAFVSLAEWEKRYAEWKGKR